MSELAYEADYRARYGCGIDEDPPYPNEDDEHEDDADSLNEPAIIPPPL